MGFLGEIEQPRPAIIGIRATLHPAGRFQPVEQAHQGDRFDFQHIGRSRLIGAFVAGKMGQHRPLGTGQAELLCPALEIAAQEPGRVVKQEAEGFLWGLHVI